MERVNMYLLILKEQVLWQGNERLFEFGLKPWTYSIM